MATQQESLSQQIIALLENGTVRSEIESQLVQKGHEERFVSEIVRETIRLHDSRKRSLGLVLILGGALLCLVSCVVTIFASFSNTSFPMILYGLTTVGILVVFAGLMKIF